MKKTGEILIVNEELFKLYSQVSINVGIDKCYPFFFFFFATRPEFLY